MKVAIIAGGRGTRFSEQTDVRPKPLIEIGGQPILWHIIKQFEYHGFREFAVALGYKGDAIKRWFLDLEVSTSDISIDYMRDSVQSKSRVLPDWQVDLVETGLDTGTGGRIKALASVLGDETCIACWGDGVSDVDLGEVRRFHRSHGKLATMVVVHPPSRYGHVDLVGDRIARFEEKPARSENWINSGIFVLEPQVRDYIHNAQTMFEQEPLEALAKDGQLMGFRHEGFWQSMDTVHDQRLLEQMWDAGDAPWANWKEKECVRSLRVISDM